MPEIDYTAVREAAEGHRTDMVAFLRALIRSPGTSCQEEAKARLLRAMTDIDGYPWFPFAAEVKHAHRYIK